MPHRVSRGSSLSLSFSIYLPISLSLARSAQYAVDRQGDLTLQTGRCSMYKLLLSDQRGIPMGGRNTETRRRPCLAVEAYGPAFTTHICTYV